MTVATDSAQQAQVRAWLDNTLAQLQLTPEELAALRPGAGYSNDNLSKKLAAAGVDESTLRDAMYSVGPGGKSGGFNDAQTWLNKHSDLLSNSGAPEDGSHGAVGVDGSTVPVEGNWTSHFDNMLGTPPKPPPQADTSNQDADRARQQALIAQLHEIASGKQKTPAEQTLERTYALSQRAAYNTAANTRDIGGGEARRMGQQNSDALGMEASGAQAVLRAQQTQQANELLAGLYSGAGTGDANQANFQAAANLTGRDMQDQNTKFNVNGALNSGVADYQYWQELANADLGFGLDQENLNNTIAKRLLEGGAGLAKSASRGYGSGGASRGFTGKLSDMGEEK